ncbi:hypothetical protein CVT25_003853 [Psilocybe cyanescens]|uniref:Uncharacterized protein n=1 Tax=Psilocybe cyanescens TaxID=93625 RepID=A0A409WY41_PSICY|nr:hypothetical protein CVT25_003853 [Psilocybe cyanescens]
MSDPLGINQVSAGEAGESHAVLCTKAAKAYDPQTEERRVCSTWRVPTVNTVGNGSGNFER